MTRRPGGRPRHRTRPLGGGETARLARAIRANQAEGRKQLRVLGERCTSSRSSRSAGPAIAGPHDIAAGLGPELGALEQEQLRVALLDRGNRLLGAPLVYQGTADGIQIRLRDVFREVIRVGAAGLVLVHNHPSGDPGPSAEDVELTAEVGRAGALLGVSVLDHVILVAGGYVSLRERGLYTPPRGATVDEEPESLGPRRV